MRDDQVRLVVDGRFPSLNDFVNAANRSRWSGADMKRRETKRVRDAALRAGLPRMEDRVDIHFHWVEPNARRDLDNIRFAAKFILDGLVVAGVLWDDSRRYVGMLSDSFAIDKRNPRVEITLTASTGETT